MGRSLASTGQKGTLSPLVCLTLMALAACSSRAAGDQSAPPTHAHLELVADRVTAQGSTLWLGVLFHLDPGWHVYWQNPGDSGTPPKIAWNLPANYRAGAIRWPAPVRLGSGSVIDYGYQDHVLLMVPITGFGSTKRPGDSISADVKYVVCSEVCIPGKAHLALPATSSDRGQSDAVQWHDLFQKTRAHLPKPAPASWRVAATQDKSRFMLRVSGIQGVKAASFVPREPDEIENSATQVFAPGNDRFSLTLEKSDQLVKPVSVLRGLILIDAEKAYEIAAPVVQ